MNITGMVRLGSEFELQNTPTSMSASTFTALLSDTLLVTRTLADLWSLEDSTLVLAHWHGNYRTEGFSTSVGELREKAIKKGYKSTQ